MKEAEALLKMAKSLVAVADIDINSRLADSYMKMGQEAYDALKKVKGAKTTALKSRNKSDSTFSFEWVVDGYTRGDFEAKAEVAIVVYSDGTVYFWVEGTRPDWGKYKTKVLDANAKQTIPLGKIKAAIEHIFG